MTLEQTESCITTWSGRWFDILAPQDYEYDIKEIAHSLSNLCRYTGHTNSFYSVAEHSVLVSRLVPDNLALCGLLHDASEAFLGDVASPLKKLLPDYKAIETNVEQAIADYYGLPFPFPAAIKEADKKMYWQERQSIANNGLKDELWHQGNRATRKEVARGMSPEHAFRFFMYRYNEIMKGKENSKDPVSKTKETF